MHLTKLVDLLASHCLPSVDMNDKVRIYRLCVPYNGKGGDLGPNIAGIYRWCSPIWCFLSLFSCALCDQLIPLASSLYTDMPFSKIELDAICKALTP